MKVYSLIQISPHAEIGCYGVFSSYPKATQYAIAFAKDCGQECAEETVWDGFTKKVYCGEYEFEIYKHELDLPGDSIWYSN